MAENIASFLNVQVNPTAAKKGKTHISQVLPSPLDILFHSNKLNLFIHIKTIYHIYSGAIQQTCSSSFPFFIG